MRDILVYASTFDSWSPGLAYAARFAAAFDTSLKKLLAEQVLENEVIEDALRKKW